MVTYVKQNYFEIMLKSFQGFISHVPMSETEIKLFRSLIFQNYFSDIEHVEKYLRAAITFKNNFKIISGKFSRAEVEITSV